MQTIGAFPIRLDNTPYSIVIESWKARDITDFSPKTNVPGTGAVFGDLKLHQPIAMHNWQHGLGYIWHDDEMGYLSSEGNIDTRHKNVVALYTNATSSDTNNNIKEEGVVFNSIFFARGAAGLRYYESAAWNALSIQRPIFDAASEGSGNAIATAGTVTVSHTVTTEGTNRALFVGVIIEASTNVTGVAVTYAGVAMTLVTDSSVGTTPNVRAFVLVAPSTGANNIIVTYTISSGTVETVVLGASFIYVDQTTPYDAVSTENPTAVTTNTISPTATARENVLDFLAKDGAESGDAASVQSTGQVQIAQDDMTTGNDIHACASYLFAVAADTTPDLQWNWTNARDIAHVGIPINPIAETTVTLLFENGEYLFAQPSGQRLLKSVTGTANWTPAGLNNASNDYSWMEIHGGYIFAGKTAEAQVYFDSNSDLSALAGDPADDSDELIAGPGTTGTKLGVSFLEKLAVSRSDGLWTMDTDDANTANWIPKRTLNFKNLSHTNNFRSMATHGGSLYFTLQDRILFEWNGARLQNITPGPITDSWEYVNYHRFDNLTPFGDWLLFSARTSETTYTESIFAWDGVGIHKLLDPITDGDGSISFIAIDTQNSYIWYHVNKPTANTNVTYYVQYQSASDLPHPNFPTSGTHRITTSRIHAGYRRVDKSMPALWLETDNCSSSRTIKAEYALDTGSFIEWDTITSDGEHILYLPQNKKTEEFKYIRLRFTFSTGSVTETPVLEGFAMMVMMRPDFLMGYSFSVIGGTNSTSGMFEDERTGWSIMQDLRSLRDRKDTISLVTPFGDEVHGYLTSLTEEALEWEPEDYEGGKVNILQVIHVNFAESMQVAGTELDAFPEF